MDLGIKEIEQRLQDKMQKAKESDRALLAVTGNGSSEKSIIVKVASDIILRAGLKHKDVIKKMPGLSSIAKRAYWRIIRNKYY